MTVILQRPQNAGFLQWRQLRENGAAFNRLSKLRLVHIVNVIARQDLVVVDPYLPADAGRHQRVIAGEHLHANAMLMERGDRLRRARFWRIEKRQHPFDNQPVFVRHAERMIKPGLWQFAGRHHQYPEPLRVVLAR